MPTDYQISPYQPVNSLEVLGVGIQQAIDGEISFGSMRDLAIPSRRTRLTPAERDSITDSLKEKYGGDNRALRAIIGAATNPWVLLGFAVSPAGLKAVRESGRIFGFGKLLAGKESGPLSQLGGLTSAQALDGTPLAVIEEKVMHLKRELHNVEHKILSDELLAWSKKTGAMTPGGRWKKPKPVETLDEFLAFVTHDLKSKGHLATGNITDKMLRLSGRDPSSQAEHHAYNLVKTFSAAMDRASRQVTHYVPSVNGRYHIFQKGKWERISKADFEAYSGQNSGAFHVGTDPPHKLRAELRAKELVVAEEVRAPVMDHEVLKGLVDKYHLEPLIRAQRKQYQDRAVKLFYDEAIFNKTGNLTPDKHKMATLWRAINRRGVDTELWHGITDKEAAEQAWSGKGIDMLAAVAGPDLLTHSLRAGTDVGAEFLEELVSRAISPMVRSGSYTPRNVYAAAGKQWGGMDMTTLNALRAVRDSESIAETSRLVPRTAHSRTYHPEDYAWMQRVNREGGGADEFTHHARDLQIKNESIAKANALEGSETRFYTLNAFESARRYSKSTGDLWARFIPHFDQQHYIATGVKAYRPEVYKEIEVLDGDIKAALGDKYEKGLHDIPWAEGEKGVPFRSSDTLEAMYKDSSRAPRGGITLGDITGTWWSSMKNDHVKGLFRDVILPHLNQTQPVAHSVSRAAAIRTGEVVGAFADSGMGRWIEGFGKHGEEFVESLRTMSRNADFASPHYMSGQMAKWLYVGFLGANMSSVMLNMMQPLLHASAWGGLQHILPAYKSAFGEMMTYARERVKHGPIISDATRAEIYGKSFRHMGRFAKTRAERRSIGDLIGMRPDVFTSIDGVSFASPAARAGETGLSWATMSLPMKLFEKAELFNRLVAAHATDNLFRTAGRYAEWGVKEKDFFRRITETRRMVGETQFGGTPLNMPTTFMKGGGPVSGVFSNPLARQFLSFPMRALTSLFVTGPGIAPTRELRVPGLQGAEIPAVVGDFMRIMGVGAMTHEFSKELLRADMSRGLGAGAVFEVFDAGFVPPVVNIPLDLMKVTMGDELELAKSSLPGLVPGGIAMVRAMGMLPATEKSFLPDMAKNFQRTYVGWDTPTTDGYVPVFKADGTLINYEKPLSVVMKGLGINLAQHPKIGDLDGWLVSQRDMIVKMESEYISAVVAGNVRKAKGIAAEFEKRFKLPMKISKRQWKSRMRNLQVSRTERILDRIPAEYKGLYQEAVQEFAPRMGIPSEEIVGAAPTSSKRSELFGRPETVTLSPEAMEEIRRSLAADQAVPPIEEQGFNPFKSWSK